VTRRLRTHRVVIALLAGLGLSLCDRIHIHYGILTHTDTSFLGQAWWVLPMFCFVSYAALPAWRLVRRRLGGTAPSTTGGELAASTLAFFASYACTGPLDSWGAPLAALLTLAWAARLVRRRCGGLLLFSLALALLGPALEATLAGLGLFAYDHPDLGPVPIWLPTIYLHGALLISDLDGFLD
jgi:hypothetical protein